MKSIFACKLLMLFNFDLNPAFCKYTVVRRSYVLDFSPVKYFRISFSNLYGYLYSNFFDNSVPISETKSAIENRAVQFSFISLPENVCSILVHISWLRYFLKSRPYLLVVIFQLCSLAIFHSIRGIKYSVRITVSDINFA